MGFGAAIAQGVLKGVQGAGLTKLEQLKEEAKQLREDNLLKAGRAYQTGERVAEQTYKTGERVAGQTYETGEKEKDRTLDKEQFEVTSGLTRTEMENTRNYRSDQTSLQRQQLAQNATDAAEGRTLQRMQIEATIAGNELTAKTQKELVDLRRDAEIVVNTNKISTEDASTEGKINNLMTDLKNLEGFKSSTPAVQNLVEMHVRVTGKLPENLKSDGTGGTLIASKGEVKGASATEVLKIMEDKRATDPSFEELDQTVQYFQAAKMAIASANANIGNIEGVKRIPDGKYVDLAKDVKKGKVNFIDLVTTYRPSDLDKLAITIGELNKIEDIKFPRIVKQEDTGGVLQGPPLPTRPKVRSIPGRQGIQAVEGVFRGDPMRLYEEEVISPAQKASANIY